MNKIDKPQTFTRSPFLSDAELTLADVLSLLSDDVTLSPTRRRDLCSAIRRLGKLLNRDLAMVPARMTAFHHEINNLHHLDVGVSLKSVRNIKSDVIAAFRHLGISQTTKDTERQLSEVWKDLYESLEDKRLLYGLSRFIRYCNSAGIKPVDVDDEVVTCFMKAVHEGTFVKNEDKLHRQVVRLWNEAADTISGWPEQTLCVPPTKVKRTSLPMTTFPASFRDEMETYLVWLEGKDIFAEHQPPKRCKPGTIRQRRSYIQLAASVLVHQGTDIDRINSLQALVEPEALKSIARFYIDRNEGTVTSFLRCLCNALLQMAKFYLLLDTVRIDAIQEIRRRLGTELPGLTEKNRAMLRQFDDPKVLGRFLALPEDLVEDAIKEDNSNWRVTVKVQVALAIEILLMAPMRIKNLCGLRLDQHIIRSGGHNGTVHIVLMDHETKNEVPAEYELPRHLVELLDLYLKDFRPRLAAPDNPYLFPGKDVDQKAPGTFRPVIQSTIYKRSGVIISPHQFRHLAAKLILDANPANYELTRRVLHHRNIKTTINYYAGLDAKRAVRHYDETILKLREELNNGE